MQVLLIFIVQQKVYYSASKYVLSKSEKREKRFSKSIDDKFVKKFPLEF